MPKANGALLRAAALMPRSAAEAVSRAMGTDKLMTQVDHGARAAYEERVTKSGGEAAAEATPEAADPAASEERTA